MPNKKTEQPWERQKGESAQAFEAFSCYLEMGADRSIRAVSQELGKSKTLIDRWSRTNDWVERCRAWDNHVQREAQKAAIAEVREMTRRHVTAAKAIQGVALEALKNKGDAMINPQNFAAVLKFAMELERQSRMAEVAAMTEELKHSEDAGDGTAVKIICDIPRVPLEEQAQLTTAEAPPGEGKPP